MTGLNFEKMINDASNVASEKRGALLLVASPPGSGKTFGMIDYISSELIQSKKFRSFFVTPQNKNLHDTDFFKTIIEKYEVNHGVFDSEESKKRYIYQHVAVLRSLSDSIRELVEDGLPAELEKIFQVNKAFMVLQKQYYQNIEIAKLMQEKNSSSGYQSLKQAYLSFKDALLLVLVQKLNLIPPLDNSDKERIAKYVASTPNRTTDFLNHHFPTINLSRRQLIILNFSKFITSYQNFYSHSSVPISSPQCLGKALIVLDEVDEMKQILLDKIINDSLKIPFDFLAFFKKINGAVTGPQKNHPEQIMAILRKEKRFSILKKRVISLAEKYELGLEYKTDGEKNKTNFIFNLDSITLTNNDHWWSKKDQQERQVFLTKKQPQDDDLKFYSMLREVNKFIFYFISIVGIWSSIYQEKINKRRKDSDNQLSFENAMRTICGSLGFDQTDQMKIIAWYQQNLAISTYGLKQITNVNSGQYLQKHGLQLISFTDGDMNLQRTVINIASVKATPEKFLLKLVDHRIVVGLSATVNIETVISNFDIEFLREQLGEQLIDGLKNLPQKVRDEFDVSKRCRERGVTVNVIKVQSEVSIRESTSRMQQLISRHMSILKITKDHNEQLRLLEDTVDQLMKDVQARYQTDINQYTYYQTRYLELFDSFICFLSKSGMTTCLGLQSILPKSEAETDSIQMSQKKIDDIFDQLAGLICPNEKVIPKIIMIGKKLTSATVEDQVKTALSLPAEYDTRVYLLSAYKTLGVSQNLQHTIGSLENEKVINIAPSYVDSNDSRRLMVDIAGIYLGRVTQVFTQLPRKASSDTAAQWVRCYYEMASLVDSGEVSLIEVKRYSQRRSLEVPSKQFRTTTGFVGAHTRIIIQALGRLNRSFNKLPEITVMLGADILDNFNVSMMDDYQLGPVAQAMRTLQRQEKDKIITPEIIRLERWTNRTDETRDAVEKMVAGLWSTLKDQDADHLVTRFERYRETLLKQPTISFKQYHAKETWPEFAYLDYAATSYHVTRESEKYLFSMDGKGNEEISSVASGLPAVLKYPGMREYFIKNQWAVSWNSNEYVVNPVQFDNYKGILGEVAGKYIVEKIWSKKLRKLPLKIYELFDFKIDENVFVDFKNWHAPHQIDVVVERKQVISKLNEVKTRIENNDCRVIIINIIKPQMDQMFVPTTFANGCVMEVPFLIDQSGKIALSEQQLRLVGDFLNGK